MRRRVALLALVTTAAIAAPVPSLATRLDGAPNGGRPLYAEPTAAKEEPPLSELSSAHGTAVFTLNQGRGLLCYHIDMDELLSGVGAAHLHKVGGTEADDIVLETDLHGCVTDLAKARVKAIRQQPGDYYVHIHSDVLELGEARDTLAKRPNT